VGVVGADKRKKKKKKQQPGGRGWQLGKEEKQREQQLSCRQ
jgi:hypothetical protein